MKKLKGEEMPKHLANFEKLIQAYGKNGFSVGSSLTWADLSIFDFVTSQSYDTAKFPALSKVLKTVQENPKISAYLKTRPVTKF